MDRFASRLPALAPFLVQAAIGLAMLAAFVALPPRQGAMVLVPLTSAGGDRLVRAARDHGALILGRGPIAGSIAVSGARATLLLPMLREGVMTVAAFGGCVAPKARGR